MSGTTEGAQFQMPGPDYRAGYIGGDLSEAERQPFLVALRALPKFDVGWKCQCRCGDTEYVIHRGRVYCPHCGRRPDSRSKLVSDVLRERHIRRTVRGA